ncbi:MAG: hypothetical protein COB16_19090 [Rhodobacteraceae bacterium]|nr:MAG: hypothetical protein COB16_19090 [Paracoccaceae bacterium]
MSVFAGHGKNTISLGDGDNEIYSGDGNNRITVGDGQASIYVGDGNNSIRAGDGFNQIATGDGNNKISTGNGYNFIFTGDGKDDIRVGNGDGEIHSGAGSDKIRTGDGNNIIYGGDGNDTIQTGDGDDRIWGGQGNDKISAGDGYDIAYYAGSFSDYILERSSSRVEITSVDSQVSDAGSDQLSGFEAIYFQGDGTLLDLTWEGDPTLVDDQVTGQGEDPLVISLSSLLANDEGLGDRLPDFTVSEYSTSGIRVTYDGENITYNADDVLQYLGEGQVFEDSFTYSVIDPYGEVFEALVNVSLVGENDGPTAVDDLLVDETAPEATIDAGEEILVNQDTPGRQTGSSIVTFDDGSYFVAWQTNANTEGDQSGGIRGRSFSQSGVPTSHEFRINDLTEGQQFDPDIAVLANGNYVVTWKSQDGVNPSPWSIKARVFEADGTRVSDEFLVNDETGQGRHFPQIVGLEDGGFAVTWMQNERTLSSGYSTDVVVAVFDNRGVRVGDQITLDSNPESNETSPSIAALPDGGFIITRMSGGGTLDNAYDILVDFFDETGTLTSTQSLTDDASATVHHRYPIVEVSPNGQAIVFRFTSRLDDPDNSGYFATIFNADGTEAIGEFQVELAGSAYFSVAATCLDDGRFVVTWAEGPGGSVRAQVFNPDGSQNSSAFTVEVTDAGGTYDPDITALSDGRFAITWTGEYLSDTNEADIAVRIFDVDGDITSAAFTGEDSPVTIDVADLLSNDTDPEGDEFIFSLDTGTSQYGASVTYDAETGTLTYDGTMAAEIQALNTGQALEDTFTYTISDGHGAPIRPLSQLLSAARTRPRPWLQHRRLRCRSRTISGDNKTNWPKADLVNMSVCFGLETPVCKSRYPRTAAIGVHCSELLIPPFMSDAVPRTKVVKGLQV